MKRRRLTKVSINTKLIIDVIGASLIVQKAPALIDSIVTLPESLKVVAGAGAGYLAGMLLKHPDLSNASIALGAVDFISPMIDGVIGTTNPGTTMVIPSGNTGALDIRGGAIVTNPDAEPIGLADYLRLNAYVGNPSNRQTFDDYRMSY